MSFDRQLKLQDRFRFRQIHLFPVYYILAYHLQISGNYKES